MNQLNFSIRVRVRISDSDRDTISQRKVMSVLKKAFRGAVGDGSLDVTLWDSYGHSLAHWDADSTEKQTVASCFRKPLGK